MLFEVEIEKKLENGSRCFKLHCGFSTDDDSVVLFGPSGSGKSLTLKAIAGLLTPDKGRIRVGGETLFDSASNVNIPSRERRMGFVFQHYALLPHLNVRANVAFGLKRPLRRLTATANETVDGLLDLFGLEAVAEALPREISGGQQQRVAVARALALEPRILLLDEPFSALDQPLKIIMRQELKRLLDRFGIPLVMVTHDPDEVDGFCQDRRGV